MAFPKLRVSSFAFCSVFWGMQLSAGQVIKPTREHRNDLLSKVTFFETNTTKISKEFEPLSVEEIEGGFNLGGLEAALTGGEVHCRFVPKPYEGSNPNFHCLLSDKHGQLIGKNAEVLSDESDAVELRVKYKPTKVSDKALRKYKEMVTEVFASEVFRSMGFATDYVYPTQRVICHGCSEDPFTAVQKGVLIDTKYEFADASVEIQYPGVSIVDSHGNGFSFKELEDLRKKMPDRARIEFEAMVILAGFLVHSQNSAVHQRLVCPADKVSLMDNSCLSRPIGYISELGSVMGSQHYITSLHKTKGNLADWSAFPLWHDKAKCTINLLFTGDQAFSIPSRISVTNAGKDFIVKRMSSLVEDPKLGDARLRAILHKSKFHTADEFLMQASLDAGEITDKWVSVFKSKYYDLKSANCK